MNLNSTKAKSRKGLNRVLPLLLLSITLSLFACKKEKLEASKEQIKTLTTYTYEVECYYCSISYFNEAKQTKTVQNNMGRWEYKFQTAFPIELQLNVTTTISTHQSIQAYILKDNEALYGSLGYNRAELSYSTQSGLGKSSFGTLTSTPSTGGSTGGSGGGNSTGGSTKPISSTCGAKNKTGGYCQRVVVGGGRCWQHR